MKRPGTAVGIAIATIAMVALTLPDAVTAQPGGKAPDPVTCSFDAERGTLSVRVRDEREDLSFLPREIRRGLPREFRVSPSNAVLQRHGDSIAVLPDFDEGPVSCGGGPAATVFNTDRIRVSLGRESTLSGALLDLTYGRFEPGLTDEGDGSSEIEMTAKRGFFGVRMTRGADAVEVDSGRDSFLNLNADESVRDTDVALEKAQVYVDGAGSGDLMELSGGPVTGDLTRLLESIAVSGGQGDDRLVGGAGSDVVLADAGEDRVNTAAGTDVVLALGGGDDRIDCGAGSDLFLALRLGGSRVRDCERELTIDELFESQNAEARRDAASVRDVRRNRSLVRGAR